jgi:hypothetical protein
LAFGEVLLKERQNPQASGGVLFPRGARAGHGVLVMKSTVSTIVKTAEGETVPPKKTQFFFLLTRASRAADIGKAFPKPCSYRLASGSIAF